MTGPSADNNYHVDRTTPLDADTFNGIFGSVGTRLTATEAVRADFDTLIAAGTAQAIAAVQDAISPYAEEAQTKAAQISAYLTAYLSDANPIRDAVLTAVLGGVAARGDTLAKLLALIDGFNLSSIDGLTEALAALAPLDSPQIIGVGTVLTAAPGTNSAQIANCAFVAAALAALVNSAPTTLDTLNELANALGSDPNFATTTATALGNRLRIDADQGLGSGAKAIGRTNLGLGGMSIKDSVAGADLPGGSWYRLATLTASNSAELFDTASLLSGCIEYEIVISNLLPSASGVDLYCQIQSGGAFQGANYSFASHTADTGGNTSYGATGAGGISISRPGNYTANAAPGCNGSIRITDPAQSSGPKALRWDTTQPTTVSDLCHVTGGGWWTGVGAVTGIRFFPSVGNFVSGVIHINGRR
ncbi:hypothetical protein [Methylosinus sp. PW1]|uniref:hypothetical protein n=1 Tax=Methylosinus sp. PW1 TaxID=107636 RepID=UPI00068C546D|nr:hypothetical protein [Methylosinus sp. PW1]